MNTPFAHKWIPSLFLPFIGGMIYATSFPMTFAPTFFFGTIIGMSLLFYALAFSKEEMDEQSVWREIFSVLAFSAGYNLLGYYWIPETLKVFGSISFPLNWFLGFFFSLIISPHLIIFVLLHRGYKKLSVKSSSVVSSVSSRNIVYALALTLVEYYTPQQFPAHMGHSWMSLAPHLGLAPIFGAPLYSFLNFWLALSLISRIKQAKTDYLCLSTFILVLILNFSFPLKDLAKQSEMKHNLRLVQPNIGNFLKVSSENGKVYAFKEVYDLYLDLSTKSSDKKIDLIVWPETAYPRLLNSTRMKKDPRFTPRLIREVISRTGSELFTGGYDKSSIQNEMFFETEYNSAFHFQRDGKLKDIFHKMKLIPFGEGLPFGPFNQYLARYIQNISFFASGDKFTLFHTNRGTPFGAAICYEILFSSFIRDNLNSVKEQPDFLINLTNDSWYGRTAEPEQHLFLAKWRALEFQLPIVRMTNTGITSIIYPNGSETKRSKLFEIAVQDVEISTDKREKTVFQKVGILSTLLLVALLALIALALSKFKTLKS
ncbi:apolipoprotein N-acyltransferase [Halobacteriovorax marinus]|uniref:Apolipoprotein N-acyltransferase n=1 Tax=Halobacteriovorax marinus TaxID=97084 RepID=A0A1Y5FFZ7_9BACT|nr:apolipoprotein N-acyltransferase [Halobacteriovorax marinus]